MSTLYVIYDGTNRYWEHHLQGWVNRRCDATWFLDAYEARRAALACDGQVLRFNPDA